MSSRYQLDDLTVDLGARSVRRGGDPVPLTDLNYRMLACLVRHAPATVGVDQLAGEVWGTPHVTNETVAQRIRLLRPTPKQARRARRSMWERAHRLLLLRKALQL